MKKFFVLITMLTLMLCSASAAAYADEPEAQAERTVMLYLCGSDLESSAGMATYNLEQILRANYSSGEKVKFVVMTGGSEVWHMESRWLCNGSGNQIDKISSEYNQVWEAKGADAVQNPGKMVLLDGDGLTGTNVPAENELMSSPDTLKAFINYCAAHFPAKKYDLILWDHGGGPFRYAFASDEHESNMFKMMSFSGVAKALRECDVTQGGKKFDFIDFDACLMSSIEIDLALADYTDFLIVSPETEPGYGQYYTGWLDLLGKTPGYDTFKLGRKIVDDFIDFYENGDGAGGDGTLSVIDMNKLMNDQELLTSLGEMASLLKEQANAAAENGEVLFYDEWLSARQSIDYGSSDLYDLGNFASMLGIVNVELQDGQNGEDRSRNAYTETAGKINRLLRDPELIYAKGTKGIHTAEEQIYRDVDGKIQYGELGTSGISIFFAPASDWIGARKYVTELDKVIKAMPEKTDGRYSFLKKYREAQIDYILLSITGLGVNSLLAEMDASDISYEAFEEYWEDSILGRDLENVIELRDALGAGDTTEWLNSVLKQQAAEAITPDKISVRKIRYKDGKGYRVTINDAKKRVVQRVGRQVYAEIPAAKEAMENDPELEKINADYEKKNPKKGLLLGSVDGSLDITETLAMRPENEESFIRELTDWYNMPESSWNVGTRESKWYAVKDAAGNLHAASIYMQIGDVKIIPAFTAGEGTDLVLLVFEQNELVSVAFATETGGFREIETKDLLGETSLITSMYDTLFDANIPISSTSFTVSADNAGSISLKYMDISEISDIADTDGDGNALHDTLAVTDFYGARIDITDKAEEADGLPELIDMGLTSVNKAVYNGKDQTPVVVCDGKTLTAGTDYELIGINDIDTFKNVGEYSILLLGKGDYTGGAITSFIIDRAALASADVTLASGTCTYNGKAWKPAVTVKHGGMKLVSGTDYTVTYSNNVNAGTATVKVEGKGNYKGTVTKKFTIAKAAQPVKVTVGAAKLSVGKTTTVSVAGAKGTISFKSSDTTIATVTPAGKVTAKKGGTVRITATSAATAQYNAASGTVTIKVVPGWVTSLTAVNQAAGIKLTWNKAAGADGYKIYRNSTLIKTITNGSTVTYTDTKANTNMTKYIYKVLAKGPAGDSTAAKTVAVYRVNRPALSSVTNSAASEMTAKWTTVERATGYQIKYSTSKTFASGNGTVDASGATTDSRRIGKLTKGKTYYVKIRAYKVVGNVLYWSEWSPVKTVKISK